jgi:PAS domain S-box-containing protein
MRALTGTILWRLFALVGLALLPTTALQFYNEFELRRSRELDVQDQVLSLARLSASDQQQIVQGIRQVLIAMSELPSIRARDSHECNAYFGALQTRSSAFITYVVSDLTGRTFCSTNSDHRPISIAARPYFDMAVKTGTFTVGEFSTGISTGRRVIQFALPFYGYDNRMGGVIVAALSLDWLADYVAKKGISQGGVLAITDRNGTYVARFPDNAQFVGRKMPATEYLKLADDTAVDTRDPDGVERIVGFSPLGAEAGGLLVSVGLDKSQAFSAIERRTRRDLLLIVISISVVLILTYLGARHFIHRPLGKLADAANQWRQGDFAQRVEIPSGSEIGRVAAAFNTMADALEHREHELREAKEEAEEAAARITMIFESTTDGVLIVDPEWRVSYLNQSAKSRVGAELDLIGRNLSDAFPGTLAVEFNRVREAMTDRRPVSFEMQCPAHGTWSMVNAFPSEQGLAIYFRDVTEQKTAVEARRAMEEQLRHSQKMEAVGQLTGGIAHDFNNLLTVVSANLELLDGFAAGHARVRQLADAMRRAVDRGATLTGQLLAFSRQQKLDPKPVNPNSLIRDFYPLICQAVGEECEVKLSIDEGLWVCDIDAAQLQTALLNLALNARDAMPNGGTVEIETRNVSAAECTAAGCPVGQCVRLSVKDSGCGMPAEIRDRAFDPFFTTKEVGKGTGLGLSMVYGFVRQSGGQVAIESAPGAGTTVILYLPKSEKKIDAETPAGKVSTVPGGCERVLFVEDNEALRSVTSEMLAELGYQVVTAGNGPEAIRILENDGHFELLFSDVLMPQGISGVELARKAKQLNDRIRVLLTSGYADGVFERHGAVEEFEVIAKPFRRADLAQRLRLVLQG